MAYATASNQVYALKELYDNPSNYLKDLCYMQNPLFAILPKDESPSGFSGKYIPVPIIYSTPQGRSHTFTSAQTYQTATAGASFFVYRISDYEIASITNELIEATKDNAGAFIDESKLLVDASIRTISNNVALEIFESGTGSRGRLAASGGYSKSSSTVTMTLLNANLIVNFEVGMTLVAMATDGGAPTTDYVTVTAVNRVSGVITGTASTGGSALDAKFANSCYLACIGDVPSAGSGTTASNLAICGLAAWLPVTAPTSGDNFWGVDRSADPTRLAGVRYDASAYTIEEGLTNALALLNREGGRPDYAIMDFASYTALINSLGAKVVYATVKHDEVDVAFEGVRFQTAYGAVIVLADRNCQPATCYLLQMNTWKLRSLGKVPHILTYGLEGLEGLRVGTADALEIRIGHYSNLICNAPGFNAVVTLSA